MDYKKDLLAKLPKLKNIEGFPIGKDEDIIALSEPPYFTACPNPYIADFIKEHGTPYDEETDSYHREPYVGDVEEDKTDPVYMAHTYHTKVPHKAIIQYIEHFTNENDIVFDGFSGSGMTGVASKISNRNCIISDLSPVASFMGATISSDFDLFELEKEFFKIIDEIDNKYSWIYKTKHNESVNGTINYIVYSENFLCPFCKNEFVYWDLAYNIKEMKLNNNLVCNHCKAELKKSICIQSTDTVVDEFTREETIRVKYTPVLINYKVRNKSFNKNPDISDFERFQRIDDYNVTEWLPTYKYMFKEGKWGDMWRSGVHLGVQNVHHFFSKSNLIILSELIKRINQSDKKLQLTYIVTSFLTKTGSRLHNIGFKGGKINLAGAQPNSLYISSMFADRNLLTLAVGKYNDIKKAFLYINANKGAKVLSQACSATENNIPSNSIDYIFTDPPFGDNLMYSEMNFIWESWLKVFTNNTDEAIINNTQQKDLNAYYELMYKSFKEYYRVLKPRRWISIVFHNSKSSVWNALQNSISKAGFIISQVSILNKGQGTKNQMTNEGAVEKDLVISAFKPSNKFDANFAKSAGENLEMLFIDEFLTNLPISPKIERTEKMLYSKMIAYYIQRGYEIRYDAKSFYSLLHANFVQEDGFWFTAGQINSYLEYKKQQKLEGIDEVKSGEMFLFVTDEKSALVWLYNFLSIPKTFSDISVAFNQTANIQGDNVPELRELLEQNFIFEDSMYRRPQSEPEHNQLIEKREKQLLREFETLLIQAQTEKKKIKEIRKEALVFGFETCYKNKRYQDILTVAGKLNKSILENNGDLNDFVQASEIMISGFQ